MPKREPTAKRPQQPKQVMFVLGERVCSAWDRWVWGGSAVSVICLSLLGQEGWDPNTLFAGQKMGRAASRARSSHPSPDESLFPFWRQTPTFLWMDDQTPSFSSIKIYIILEFGRMNAYCPIFFNCPKTSALALLRSCALALLTPCRSMFLSPRSPTTVGPPPDGNSKSGWGKGRFEDTFEGSPPSHFAVVFLFIPLLAR
jgi:hypothetical protein